MKKVLSIMLVFILSLGIFLIPLGAYAVDPSPTPAPSEAPVLADTSMISASKNLFNMALFNGTFTRNVDDTVITANGIDVVTNAPVFNNDIFIVACYIRSKAFKLPAGIYNFSMFCYFDTSLVAVENFDMFLYVDGVQLGYFIPGDGSILSSSFTLYKECLIEVEFSFTLYGFFDEPVHNEFKFIQLEQGNERTAFTAFVAPKLSLETRLLNLFNSEFKIIIGAASMLILVIVVVVVIGLLKRKKRYEGYGVNRHAKK